MTTPEAVESAPPDPPWRRWLLALAAYAVVLATSVYVSREEGGLSSGAYWTAGLVVTAVTLLVIAGSGRPPAFFGLTSRGLRASLVSGGVSAAGLSLGCLGLAWLASNADLTDGEPALSLAYDGELLVYVLIAAPIQELIFRGVFQSCARYALGVHPRARLVSLLVSTAAYAMSHLPWGLSGVLVMVIPGLVWGKQYERDRTLWGVMLSHAIVGYVFVGVTPLWRVLVGH